MRTGIVAFLFGNTCILFWPYLSDISSTFFISLFVLVAIIVLSGVLYKARRLIVSLPSIAWHLCFLLLCFLFGIVYTSLYINLQIPLLELGEMEGKTISVKGVINSLPYKTEKKQGFDFLIQALENKNTLPSKRWDDSFKGKVRLSWYDHSKVLEIGQTWQFDVRLKKPNGLLNPGGFDYEQWLFQNRILATGYVREGTQVKEPISHHFFFSLLAKFRQSVSHRLDLVLADHPYKGLIKALTIGDRHGLSVEHWNVFLRTGTNHLIAISGLHIGLLSSLIWFLVNRLWRTSAFLNIRIPSFYVASILALLSAVAYAALAGFSIPTQRALIMLAVVLVAVFLKREFAPSYVILLALVVVLIIDPLSPLSPGFWLSFTAVAVILFSISARLLVKQGRIAQIVRLGRLQWFIFIGLLPMMILLFQQFSMLSPVANVFAVPFMSIIIVPITLLASASIFLFEPLGMLLFEGLKWPMDGLFYLLNGLSQWSDSLYYLPETSWITLLLAFFGCIWLSMPMGWKARWLGVFLLLPAFMSEGEKIPEGEIQMTVLDVGQGLSIVVRTRHYNLLYDTGDKFNTKFNMADMVIIPYMRVKGIQQIDKLVVSHSDKDHAGSYSELINKIAINEVLSGEPDKINAKNNQEKKIQAVQCHQGQQWTWDEVHFEILSPQWPVNAKKANNRSCVILITSATQQSFILTGDIEKRVEKQLLKFYPSLSAKVLLVPHHGSKTSSSQAFLKQLNPQIALFSYGYFNRFRHPAKKIVRRYENLNIKLYNTSNGAIDIRSNLTNNSLSVKQYRLENSRFWHRKPDHL